MKVEALYFTGNNCNVCHAIKPKLIKLLNENFPEVDFTEINIEGNPRQAADYLVFTIPVLIIFADGKEYCKFIRSFSLSEVKDKLDKLYKIIDDY